MGGHNNSNETQPLWNRQSTILGVTISFFITYWICVALRLYTRFRVQNAAGWDDFFVVLTGVIGVVSTVAICLDSEHGLGQHMLALSMAEVKESGKLFYISVGAYTLETWTIKISLLLQYLRIWNRGGSRKFCIWLLAVIGIWGAIFSFMAWVPCFPVHGHWDLESEACCYGFGSKELHSFIATVITHSGMNMVFDLAVFLAPVLLYSQRQTATLTWRGLMWLLLMGCLVWIISVCRLASVAQLLSPAYHTFDLTWHSPLRIILGVLEVKVAAICACVPVFWPALTSGPGRIIVTREVRITREPRCSLDDGSPWPGPRQNHSTVSRSSE
ncbi:hypothetical protein PG984_006182 [Apiospora sp. TS-2023a]